MWPTVDENALYYPALAPIALLACTAQCRRERFALIVSLMIATATGALLDTRSPQWSAPEKLASATVAVPIVGLLVNAVIDWCARQTLLAPEDPGVPGAPGSETCGEGADREELQRTQRISEISAANPTHIAALRPESLSRLTGRELQILFLVKEGLDRHDIAASLCLSPRTIDTHIQRVRAKTELTLSGQPTSLLTHRLPPFELPDQPDGREVAREDAGGQRAG